jgi:hypothetical protein
MLLLKADENLSKRGQHRLAGVFSADDPTCSLQAAWQVRNSSAPCLLNSRLTRRGGCGQERACRPRDTRCDAGDEQALPDPVPLVERDRSPHRHRCNHSQSRSQ